MLHPRDESLSKHIEFLEQQGIAGVSHHSLLYSKTEVLPTLNENDALDKRFTHGTCLARNTNSEIPFVVCPAINLFFEVCPVTSSPGLLASLFLCIKNICLKIKVFLLLLFRNSILTRDNLVERGWKGNEKRIFCSAKEIAWSIIRCAFQLEV